MLLHLSLTKSYLRSINLSLKKTFSFLRTAKNPGSIYIMKKQLLFLLFTVLSVAALAQPAAKFGVRAGVTYAGMRGDAVSNLNGLLDFANGMITTHDRTGFFAGTYATVPLGGGISVEPGLYYAEKGYELRGDLTVKGLDFLGATAKAQLQQHYIDIPVLLKADLGGGLQLFAGPQFSYLAKSNLKTTAGILGINLLNKNMDATNQFNRWDMGLSAGLGYQLKNGVNITAAYDYGLSKVDANKNVNGYNRAFKVGLGFSF